MEREEEGEEEAAFILKICQAPRRRILEASAGYCAQGISENAAIPISIMKENSVFYSKTAWTA